ncbi:hypothetical protein DEU56DRAFT_869486 [Suillus clintonianus]|uniref:uncharacterized protein n=1 Tax=Suillus clintonianus TaxID=1904413 RepID=UPI001B86B1D0|nr:uncharacterized protein DEU56DRAFT_869486 [Suillus clintonianus]KAG2149296.1 hypothetical protein DEU56DRAFT_869486 [Suillus clintonianus]
MSSNFAPTPAELALVNQIFAQADTQKIGILTGDVAVKVFQGAKLAPTVLGEIWNIADDDNNGFLTKKGVSIAVRLMGHAQKGQKVDKSLVNKPGPLAKIEGVQTPLIPQGTGASIPKSPPPSLPPLSPQDKAKFTRIFQGCGPVNGLLNGDKARNVFVKSKLSVDKLSQIWTLCDTQDRGALDITDFTIAMYLIQASMAGQLSSIPTSISPGLYEQAGGVSVHATGGSVNFSSSGFPPAPRQIAVQPQLTGQASPAPPLPNRRLGPSRLAPNIPAFPGVAPQSTSNWDVTTAEKAGADHFFDTLDPQRRGYIEGDVAVPFMLQSNLPEDVLAQVWDLADINNDGRLTRDGFAVAMHLIQGNLSGKDVPSTLPPTLVPPSMRAGLVPFATAPAPPKPEPVRDLLWDDSPPPSATTSHPPTSILQPQTTGTPLSPKFVARPIPPSQDPFGSSPATSPSNRNFLDDDDTHAPPVLHDQSAEIGNVQNQFNSTQRSLQTAKAEREALESTLANQAAQLSALQTQLASAKASYETEISLLNTLRDRHAAQIADIQRVREELIRDESDLSAVRVEKAEVEGSFLRDKEEVRDLNRRMAEVTTQIAVVKQDVEKAKKDAKQQKGLLAIAKKQLATKESEKTKVDKELEEAQQDLADTIKEREEAEAEVQKTVTTLSLTALERSKSPDSVAFAAAHPLPVTPDITGAMSPISVKSNNPFERLAMSSGVSTPRSQSPFLSFPDAPYPAPPGLSSPPGLSAPATPATMQTDLFSQAFDTEPVLQTDNAPDTDGSEFVVVTPRVKNGPYFSDDVVSSPTSDEHFTTPPTSITPVNHDCANVSSLDSVAAHFPAIDDFNAQQPAPEEGEKETDLSTDLQELEVNDTESESEDSHESEAVDRSTDSAKEVSPSEEVISSQAPTSFDDIFGVNTDVPERDLVSSSAPQSDTAAPSQNGTSLVDAFGVPFSAPLETTQSQLFQPSETSGLNSFDEALGKISNGGSTQPASAFSFDSNFEDNFDFGTAMASSSTFPPLPAGSAPANGVPATTADAAAHANGAPDFFTQPASNGISATPKVAIAQPAAPVSFDEVFSSGPWNAPNTAPQPEKAESKQADAGGISFQDAFGGVDVSQALALDNSFSSRTSKPFTSSASPPPSEGGKPFPNVSPPSSPRGSSSPRVTSLRSGSPPRRATSPPPRAISPKLQRPSSSSAKDGTHDKPAPPPRHSKLSIRLPFGKRKKQDSVPPIPPSNLSQNVTVMEQPRVTPGVEDDVEPVKQLSAMGFSRNQAVAALEAHDYDVQRALNSLLGAQ